MLQITSANRPTLKVGRSEDDAHLKTLVDRRPLFSCEICVIVPVRDEAENITATLTALTHQIDLTGKPFDKSRYEIIVLANNCSDNSAEVVRRFARTHPDLVLHLVEMTIEGDRAHIGWVGKLLLDEACRRFKAIGRNFGVIASTDGDTKVSPSWIAATRDEINRGADAVGGRIITCSESRDRLDPITRLYYLRYQRYGYLVSQLEARLDPSNCESSFRHHHHYGASLAVTAQMYALVGGLPPLRSSEDVALYDALMRVDARFRHSPRVRVITSARAVGRAEAGLSQRLSQLNAMTQKQQSIMVEPAELVAIRFYLRRWLRYLWQNRLRGFSNELSLVARKLDLTDEVLQETILRSPTFGLLVEQIGRKQNREWLARGWQNATIEQAIADMSTMLEKNYYPISLDTLEQIQPIPLLPQPL